ncbi:hypothetical protein IPA_06465 [Ignicoccus pacificus DSM 13166]|uniref:Proteasome assembly chaperone family protein n=1 Tax=Ignicoccus pacificus DSM 13166 TaxID=940294 RepID=A0A977PK77_9CREN|nr:hypothetical protein IPA_06465 [Ignicoccus pacificus DSM 13166]
MIPVEFWEKGERPLKYLVVGFHDVGLVGIIATKHLIESLGMEEVGGIDIPSELPIAPIRDGLAKFPITIYKKDQWAVFYPEVPLPPTVLFPIAQAIMDYAARMGVERIISLTGLANPNRLRVKPSLHWIIGDEEIEEKEKLEREGKPLKDGVLYGPTALLLKFSKTRGIPVVALLADAFPEFPDPGAAATVLEGLSKVYGISVDTKKLIEDAEKIKARLQEMARQAMTVMKESGARPMMYA